MRLRDHLRTDIVLADLGTSDRTSTLARIAELVAEREPAVEQKDVYEALELREAAHPTAMGHGVALPHATLAGLDRTILGVATAGAPVPWGGEDEGARLFFILLSPPGAEGTHIKLLARISRLVCTPGVLDDLLSADSADGVVREILRHDEAHV